MAEAPSESSLQILGGALNGHRFVFPATADDVTIGSDPDCSFALDAPGISPLHARLVHEAEGWFAYDCRAPQGLYVNDDPVAEKARLQDGDFLWLGQPGADDAMMVQVRFAPEAEGLSFEEADAVAYAAADADAAPEFATDDAPAEAAPDFALGEPEAPPDFAAEDVVETEAPPEFATEEPAPEEAEAPPEFAVEEMPAGDQGAPEFALDEAAPAAMSYEGEAAAETYEPAADEAFAQDAEAPLEMAGDSGSGGYEPPADEALDFAPELPTEAPELPMEAPEPEQPPPAPVYAAPPPPVVAPPPAPAKKIQKHDTSGMGWEAPEREAPHPEPAAPAPAPSGRHAPAPVRAAKPGGPSPAVLAGGVAAVLALAVGGYFAWGAMKTPKAAALTPSRAAAGQVMALTGENFAPDAAGNVVKVGTTAARVKSASPNRIEFELPAISGAAGKDQKVAVTVDVGGRVSNPVDVAVYQRPRIQAISPDVARSGDVVTLSGDGWAAGAEVRFGAVKAEQVAVEGKELKVTVPALEVPSGAAVPVTVAMGADASAPANLLFGRLPLVIARTPEAAQPGQLVTLKGRGFKPAETRVSLAGAPALLVSVKDDEIQMVVPRQDADGAAELRIDVAGLEPAEGGALTVSQGPGGLLWRFVPEPTGPDAEGKQTAALATGFGPTIVLSATATQSAAQRALEAQKRLASAGDVLAATPGLEIQARALDRAPAVGLAGRAEVLLEPTDEDVAYYAHESKGAAVNRARLAVWWAAVAQDVALATIRKDQPRYAAALGAEGKVLADAQKQLGNGATPLAGLAKLRDALRVVATRVPASVKDPTAGPPEPEAPALVLDGEWHGKEVEKGAPKFVTVIFKTKGSTLAYQTGVSMSTPIKKQEVRKGGKVYFLIGAGNKLRHYLGAWDGKKISGKIAANESGAGEIGTFELSRQ